MILTYLFGVFLLNGQHELIYENYFIIKLFFVLSLSIYQVYLVFVHINFKKRKNIRSGKFYKLVNEIPTVFMIFIILLVVLKPNIG